LVGCGGYHHDSDPGKSPPPKLHGRDSRNARQVEVEQNKIRFHAMSREFQSTLAVRCHVDCRLGFQATQHVAHGLLNERMVINHKRSYGETSGLAR
jgi:hypothetical protein